MSMFVLLLNHKVSLWDFLGWAVVPSTIPTNPEGNIYMCFGKWPKWRIAPMVILQRCSSKSVVSCWSWWNLCHFQLLHPPLLHIPCFTQPNASPSAQLRLIAPSIGMASGWTKHNLKNCSFRGIYGYLLAQGMHFKKAVNQTWSNSKCNDIPYPPSSFLDIFRGDLDFFTRKKSTKADI